MKKERLQLFISLLVVAGLALISCVTDDGGAKSVRPEISDSPKIFKEEAGVTPAEEKIPTEVKEESVSKPARGEQEKKPGLTIGQLWEDTASYEGKSLSLEGKFLGWRGKCPAPHITRSDWAIEDETGCIYVVGRWPDQLDPVKGIGTPLIVKGVLELKNNQIPYLRATSIKVIKEGN